MFYRFKTKIILKKKNIRGFKWKSYVKFLVIMNMFVIIFYNNLKILKDFIFINILNEYLVMWNKKSRFI